MASSVRYILIKSMVRKRGKVVDEFCLLSSTTYSILEFLTQHGGEAYYSDLASTYDVSLDILYVMCQRLEAQGLVKRVKRMQDSKAGNRRLMTIVKLVRPFERLKVNVLK